MSASFRHRIIALLGFFLILAAGPAHAFDRIAASTQYQQWLVQLKSDINTVYRQVPREQEISKADIARWCAESVVPGSRGEDNLAEWLNSNRGQPSHTRSGEIIYVSAFRVLMNLFEASIPAGDGGIFPEPVGSPYPDLKLHAIYMHIDGGESLERYFKEAFIPYRLPPEGKVERDAYPFLLFEQSKGKLRFGGVGKEWWGAFQRIYNVQFH